MKRSLTPDEIEYYQSQGYNMQNYKGEALEFPDESSVKGSVGRSALVSALPTAAGGAAFAGTMLALAPETLGASLLAIPAAAAMGYGGSKLASKIQEPLMSEDFKKQLAIDAQMHPYATAGGALATMPLGGFNPSPANVAKAGGALGRLALGLGTNTAERQALVNVGSGAALGGIQEAVLAPIEGRDITAKDVALAAASGGVFSKPNPLGKNIYGFHDGTGRVVETPAALAKQLAPANAQQRAPLVQVQPNLTMEEYINKALVPAMNKDNTPRLSKSAETSGKNISDLLEKGADVVSRESIQGDVDKRVKAILEKEQKAQKPATIEVPKGPTIPSTELKTEVAGVLKAKNLSAALTPEYADTVISEILNERGIQVAPDGSLPINGKAFFDEGTRKVLFNPDKAAVDTLPHEGLHHMRWDLEAAAEKGDARAKSLLEAWDKLSAPELEKINAERLAAKLEPQDAHEFAVSQQGFEFVKQQLNLKRETPWKKWWNDTKALFNAKYNTGKVSLEDMRRAVNFKFVHERQKLQTQVGNKQEREQPFEPNEVPEDPSTWSKETSNIVEDALTSFLKSMNAHEKFGTKIPGLSKEAQARIDAKRASKLERNQGGQESLIYSPDDLAEYNRLKAEQLRLISEGKVMDKEGKMTPEFHQVWTDFEKVRNRNNGMPPKQYEGRTQGEGESLVDEYGVTKSQNIEGIRQSHAEWDAFMQKTGFSNQKDYFNDLLKEFSREEKIDAIKKVAAYGNSVSDDYRVSKFDEILTDTGKYNYYLREQLFDYLGDDDLRSTHKMLEDLMKDTPSVRQGYLISRLINKLGWTAEEAKEALANYKQEGRKRIYDEDPSLGNLSSHIMMGKYYGFEPFREQPEGEGLSSDFTPKPARTRIRTEEEKAKMRADRKGYAEQAKSEYDKIVKPEERRSAGVKPHTYPQDKEWTALFDTRENTPARRIPLSDVVNLDSREGMADFNEYVRRAVYTAANRIRAEKKGADLPPSYDPQSKTYGIGRQDYDEIAATVAANVKANGVDRDNYQGAGAMTLKRTLYRRARDAWKEAIRIKSQEKGQRSLDKDVGEEGETSVMDVTPDTTETQTRATVVPEVKKGMSPQEAAAAKVKALEEERATAVEEYGENSDAVGEIDNEIEMWSKRAGRAQGEGEGLKIANTPREREAVVSYLRDTLDNIAKEIDSKYEDAVMGDNITGVGRAMQAMGFKSTLGEYVSRNALDPHPMAGDLMLRFIKPFIKESEYARMQDVLTTARKALGLENMTFDKDKAAAMAEQRRVEDAKAYYKRMPHLETPPEYREQPEGEGLSSEQERQQKSINPEWRQDQKEEQDSLYRPTPTSASKRKFDEMRAVASREQPLDEGLRQDLLKDTVLHTVRDEKNIPEIIKSGLLRGSNVSMDGLKENQSLGNGVTLVYDKQHISAESKGYNPNDGIVTRQQPAKPKAILVEVGDIIEDAPITMDELLAKIESITERQNAKDKIADERYKKSLADYNKQLAELQVSKTADGYQISTPSKTEKVKGAYDPRKGYSEETERTIPSISKPFSEIKIGDSNYLKMANHHVSLRKDESVQDAARRFFAEKFLELKEPEQNTKRNRMEEYELDKLYSKFDSMTQKGIDKHPGYTHQDYIDSLNLPKDIPTYTYEANEDGGMDNIRRIYSGRMQGEEEGLFSGKHSFFSAMAPTFDKVKTINPELGDAFDKWEIAKRGYTGMRNEALASLQKFNPEDVKRVAELRREAFRNDNSEPLNLTGEDADINEALKKYYFDDIGMARKDLGLLIDHRAAGTNENYQPDMLNEQTIDLFVSRPNSPEALYAVNKWAEYVAEHSEGEISFTEAKKHINDYIDAIGGKNDNYKSVNFGAIRKAQGYGLPDELRELDPLKTLSRYGSRAASDLAMFQELESKPAIAAALKIPNPNTGKIPDHPNAEMRYSAQKEVRNAMKWVMNDFGNTLSKSQPHVNAFVRLVHNSLLGGATGLRDLASVPVNMMPYIHSFSDLSTALKGMVNFREHAADALRSGAKQPNLDLVQFNTILDSPSRGLAIMHKAATAMRKWQGREALENFSRDITFAAGKELALAHIEGAKNGNRNSEKFIEKFGKGAEGKEGEEAANIMAANFTERNQGTYGGRGLPVGIVESQFAPFFSLQKWGVEKANVIFQDVFKPALTGENYVPLLTYSLGTILTGAAIQEMNKVLMGRKPQDPDIKEAIAKGDAKAYAQELATLMQLGNFSGIVGDVMKAAVDAGVRGKTARNVVSFPTYTAVSDTGEKLTDMAEAIRQGENPWEVIKMFSIDMLSQNIQNVRALANRTVKEKDLERSDKFRDRRIYNELEGKPAGEIPKINKYLGIEERKFKQASTPAEIRELLPQVLAKAKRQAEGNPEKLRQAIVSLKGNSYQTMPSPTDSPYEFRAYYEYLVKTQGKTEADKRVKDYLTQRMLNQQKSRLLPAMHR